jgi:general stress protein CsbA
MITDPAIINVLSTLHKKNPDFVFNTETYYIPESWYIQLMIEGGIFGALIFAIIILILLFQLRRNKYLVAATLGILLMNLVLHSFESVHTAFMWSMVVASCMLIPQLPTGGKHLKL